tara:strand:- start:688 stop:1071 length:384 start_codon:yes stop_codon:yes gene_type:complete
MSTIEKRTKQLKFTDELSSDADSSYYDVTVSVTEKLYNNGKTYFDIDYEYKFNESTKHPNNVDRMNAHPFCDNLEDAEGYIIVKNSLTSIMVDFLLMDDDELINMIGVTTIQRYRKNLMHSLALFWD